MKINENTAISTPRVLLVPYEHSHVLKYHGWMQDPAIQEATASEPLTLEEEFSNQESWRISTDKLTFIVCQPVSDSSPDLACVRAGEVDSPEKMIGDINFFIYPLEDDDKTDVYEGEVDIMIADAANRSKGFGREAVTAFLRYILRNTKAIMEEFVSDKGVAAGDLDLIMARIKEENAGSIRLFQTLGFEQVGEVNYFGEIKLVLSKDKFTRFNIGEVDGYTELEYRRSAQL